MEEDTFEKVISPQDRCDRCNSQAYFLVVFDEGELYFCRHHFLEYKDVLQDRAYHIVDESEELMGA